MFERKLKDEDWLGLPPISGRGWLRIGAPIVSTLDL
jgi:hypothetical protein